jgi:hypothetical protein
MERGAIEGGTSLQFGSPLYMAPEHFEGKPSQRSDLYALGVILYQMLTGRHPFEASVPAAVMRKHLIEPPPSLHMARPDLPVALDAVLAKALAKQPEQRYERAGELLIDFRAALSGPSSGSNVPTQRFVPGPTVDVRYAPAAGPQPIAQQQQNPGIAAPQPQLLPAVVPAALPATPSPVPAPASAAAGKPKIWTWGFTMLFVLMTLAGGVAILVVNFISTSIIDGKDGLNADGSMVVRASFDFGLIDWIALLFLGIVTAAYLVGGFFVRSKLLRAGLLLQAGSFASNIVLWALILQLNISPPDQYLPFQWSASHSAVRIDQNCGFC